MGLFTPTPTFGAAGEEQPLSGFADPGALAAAANAAGQPGTENLDVPGWSDNLAQAFQTLGKSSLTQQPAAPAALKPMQITEVPAGRPRQAASLDALAKLLQQRQAQYTGLSGQPVAMPRTAGLLGF